MKKNLIVILLVLSLGRTQASTTQVVFCVGIGIAAIAAVMGVKIFAQRCETHKYCWKNPEDGTQYCRTMTKSMAASCGTNVLAGPFDKMDVCNISCSQMATNGVSSASELYPVGDDLPPTVTLERTFALESVVKSGNATWSYVNTFDLDQDQTNQLVYVDTMLSQAAFYRFRYDVP